MMTRNSADEALLRDWTEGGSETAFAGIVRRRIGLVYHVCLRELQDRSLAEDATQAVFLLLAQKGNAMPRSANLIGWLFRTSRLVCKDLARSERRRKRREHLAGAARPEPSAEPGESLANTAIINDALSALRQTEREAVLLRFYDQMSFQEVGEALEMSDDTAQKCVSRALEKMRRYLTQAGITLTSVAVGAFLSSESARSVPPEVQAKALLTASAIPGGQIASILVGTKAYQIAQGMLHTMRLKMIAATSTATVFIACGILLATKIHEGPHLTMEKVRAHYVGAKSFSMTIINHDSSGLLGGDFTQRLVWHNDGKFTLTVISPKYRGVNTPNYYSDGTKVIAAFPGGLRQIESPPGPNNATGWEISAGYILSWLENTPYGGYLLNGLPGGPISWTYGPRTRWHGYRVKEMVMHASGKATGGTGNMTASLYIDPATNEYLGFDWTNNGKPSYSLYKDQKLTR